MVKEKIWVKKASMVSVGSLARDVVLYTPRPHEDDMREVRYTFSEVNISLKKEMERLTPCPRSSH
jgi:hypothetical protein